LNALNAFDNFLWAEDENTKRTQRTFGKDFELYKRSFNLMNKTLHHLCVLIQKDPSRLPTSKKVILMITIRSVHTMQSIRVLNLKGYYSDVKVLERCLLESMGLCSYFALNEKETEKWIKGKDRLARIRLVDYIFLLLGAKGRSGIPFYGKLSKFVHTSPDSIAYLLVDTDDETMSMDFALTPIFNREKVSGTSWMPILMLVILGEMFRDELTEKRKEQIKRLEKQYVAEINQ
jgi:hypothetical protein